MGRSDVTDCAVIAANLSFRYSGINSTLERVVAVQQETYRVAVFAGIAPPAGIAHMGWGDVWRLWSKPPGRPFRIFHCRRNNDMLAGVLLRDILRMPMKLVFTSAAQRDHTWLTRALLRRMDAVIATSDLAASYIDRHDAVIPHGIDCTTFRPEPDKSALRRKLGLEDEMLIGCFGRVRPDKGTHMFVEAMLQVMDRHPQARAVISGLVKADQAGFVASMKRTIESRGKAARFHWLGEQPASAMPELFRAVDLYVAPQLWEGFGVTPLEAMASGAPVVATTVGAFPLQVVEGVTGSLVAPGEPAAIADALCRYIEDGALRRRTGEAARRHVVENWGIRTEAESINAVYEKVWSEAGAGAVNAGIA